MSGWQSVEGILASDPGLARIGKHERDMLQRLSDAGWTVRIEAAGSTTVTVERGDHRMVVHDATLRLALAMAIEETGA